jgi:hypothetical protein
LKILFSEPKGVTVRWSRELGAPGGRGSRRNAVRVCCEFLSWVVRKEESLN